jgi:hypothetical protein
MCVYIYIYIYMRMCACYGCTNYVCMYIYLHVCVFVCVHAHMYNHGYFRRMRVRDLDDVLQVRTGEYVPRGARDALMACSG